MFRSLMTIIRELYLYLSKVIFMTLYVIILYKLGDVAACLQTLHYDLEERKLPLLFCLSINNA